jgi:hypothetical protein
MCSICSSSYPLNLFLSGTATLEALFRISGSLEAGEQILEKDRARGGTRRQKSKELLEGICVLHPGLATAFASS